jgi:hypothetical protein
MPKSPYAKRKQSDGGGWFLLFGLAIVIYVLYRIFRAKAQGH